MHSGGATRAVQALYGFVRYNLTTRNGLAADLSDTSRRRQQLQKTLGMLVRMGRREMAGRGLDDVKDQ